MRIDRDPDAEGPPVAESFHKGALDGSVRLHLYLLKPTKISFVPPPPSSVFKNPVSKLYRFQTVDSQWMQVREQMAECTVSFGIPKQLLALYIQEDAAR